MQRSSIQIPAILHNILTYDFRGFSQSSYYIEIVHDCILSNFKLITIIHVFITSLTGANLSYMN